MAAALALAPEALPITAVSEFRLVPDGSRWLIQQRIFDGRWFTLRSVFDRGHAETFCDQEARKFLGNNPGWHVKTHGLTGYRFLGTGTPTRAMPANNEHRLGPADCLEPGYATGRR
ncbi:hypothetical protein MMB17_07270 [Methylobacterium organophilum]|uniref:hypothetical protein n=1 Tax=Methylobacterium organophilum TaxID=410 RepID=UPI001F137ECE|nr:hypothetical protein [Methylobacterium organophilum]UMY19090.1 hypothetical protein MMB17_07270 [Methylobacterium organophilum]